MPEIKNGDHVTVNHPVYGTITGTASSVMGRLFVLKTDTLPQGTYCMTTEVVARYQMVAV